MIAAFFMKEDVSQNALFEILGSLMFVAKFSKKEKKFTNLVGDGMSKWRPIIFLRWQGSIRLVWKHYSFGRTCWIVEMLQWFAVLDFVLILSLIQISQLSWSRATFSKAALELFCILTLTSFESYLILSRVCWHFCRWLCCEWTSYIVWIFKIWV